MSYFLCVLLGFIVGVVAYSYADCLEKAKEEREKK